MPPWRYSCPEYGAHSLSRRVHLGGYRCQGCGTILEQRYDKKRDQLTT